MSWSYYRRKPVIVQAIQYDGTNATEILDWIETCWPGMAPAFIDRTGKLFLETGEGDRRVDADDFVVRDTRGAFFSVKPAIFAATYESVAS